MIFTPANHFRTVEAWSRQLRIERALDAYEDADEDTLNPYCGMTRKDVALFACAAAVMENRDER